jgi:hypothetical protein
MLQVASWQVSLSVEIHHLFIWYMYNILGTTGIVRDQRYRTGVDVGMPMPDWIGRLTEKLTMPD